MKLLLKARSGLVKKVVTDKRGRKTTVWVKPDKKKGGMGDKTKDVIEIHETQLRSNKRELSKKKVNPKDFDD